MTKSAQYRVRHRTSYRYSSPVALCQNQLRMRPQDSAHLRCFHCDLSISPEPEQVISHQDYFGNWVDSFSIESYHSDLEVVVASHLEVSVPEAANLDDGPTGLRVLQDVQRGTSPEDWRAREFTFGSPRIQLDQSFRQYAQRYVDLEAPLVEAVNAITNGIHQDFQYDTTATDVNTSTFEALSLRAGVCQDFAHVQIAALRSLGIPARYVSGYLRTIPPQGQERMVGSDESHAWVSVYAGSDLGWIDFDPTNAVRTMTDHIPVCIGRDYDDVSPMRGVVLGGGKTDLKVSVDVAPVNQPADETLVG